jgi:hypothetical protein
MNKLSRAFGWIIASVLTFSSIFSLFFVMGSNLSQDKLEIILGSSIASALIAGVILFGMMPERQPAPQPRKTAYRKSALDRLKEKEALYEAAIAKR